MVLDQPNTQFGPVDAATVPPVEPPKQHHRYRMILVTGIVILVGISGIVVSQNTNLQQIIKNSTGSSGAPTDNGQSPGENGMMASTIAERTQPWIEITSKEGKTTYMMNENITLKISGFSQGKDITGYDLVLPIDTTMFEVVSTTSVMPGFSIFEFDKGSYRTVTGIKDVGVQDVTAFDNTALVEIVLKPKKQGTSTIGFSEQGKEKTQFVDSEVNVIVPQGGSLQVEVQ